MEDSNLWVEPVGNIIVARLRGLCTPELLLECERRVLALAHDTRHVRVLYDTLEMNAPEMELVLMQQRLEMQKKKALGTATLRTAILVPNTRIAFLSRIAFGHEGEEHYRVFYNDMGQALKWLEQPPA
jgi:hypothetical protein